jgi:hypothetical protein
MRRHIDVFAEAFRADLHFVIDQLTAIGEKLDRSIASSAIEHAAVQAALHKARITGVKTASDRSTPTNS